MLASEIIYNLSPAHLVYNLNQLWIGDVIDRRHVVSSKYHLQ